MMNPVLLIFTKNPVYGKVKTRLAATVGNDKAFDIYKKLIEHTYIVTKNIQCDKIVFYSDEIEVNDVWKNDYTKQVQYGNDLGEKMMNAFTNVFKNNYLNAVIIGTDCPELNEQIINNAFEQLEKHDIIIGPAADGGYYLLGMKKMHLQLFEDIEWSTNTVLHETIKRFNENNFNYFLLPVLHDVDEEKDLQYMKQLYENSAHFCL